MERLEGPGEWEAMPEAPGVSLSRGGAPRTGRGAEGGGPPCEHRTASHPEQPRGEFQQLCATLWKARRVPGLSPGRAWFPPRVCLPSGRGKARPCQHRVVTARPIPAGCWAAATLCAGESLEGPCQPCPSPVHSARIHISSLTVRWLFSYLLGETESLMSRI